MKAAFIFFLLGGIVGAVALHYFEHLEPGPAAIPAAPVVPAAPVAGPAPSLADKARASASQARDAIAEKLVEWHLTPDDIRSDLAKTGQVVRSKAATAGENMVGVVDNARIVTVIKAKYVLDRDLSAMSITVGCQDGEVTLVGTVPSAEQIGRATALALDTDGVHHVVAKLTVAAK